MKLYDTPYGWVRLCWETCVDGYDRKMDVETAARKLEWMRDEGEWDVPEDLTAEDFSEWWNEFVDEQKKWEAEQDE